MAQGTDASPESRRPCRKDRAKAFGTLVLASVQAWQKGNASRLAAALAYYALLSMAPTLYIIILVVGSLYGGAGAELAELQAYVETLFGPQAAQLMEGIIQGFQLAGPTTWNTLIGVGVLVWGGSGFFIQLRDALNAMWGVPPAMSGGALHTILSRLLSFAIVLGIGVLLFVAILINTTLTTMGHILAPIFSFSFILMQVIQYITFFALFVVLIALMYKIVPDAAIAWGDVWVGAAVTAILFMLGQVGLGIYLRGTRFTTFYGVAGILVVVLVWVYYSAQIVFLGAQFTREYANRYGSHIRPSRLPITRGEPDNALEGK